jgi:predicted metal-dependent phosphoesterase TrpH
MTQPSRFRYDGLTRWWKGNLHVHSTRSDGGKTPAELAELYAGAGYDFIVLADHWVAGVPDDLPRPSPLTVLDGVELDGDDSTGANFHVVCIGCRGGIDRTMGLEAGMAEAKQPHRRPVTDRAYRYGQARFNHGLTICASRRGADVTDSCSPALPDVPPGRSRQTAHCSRPEVAPVDFPTI